MHFFLYPSLIFILDYDATDRIYDAADRIYDATDIKPANKWINPNYSWLKGIQEK